MSPRVLVVEDEPTIRRAVGYALRRDGFDVEEVDDGRGALEADAETFDVVLLDLGLPTVSGTEVLRRLRAAGSVPIIVLTALGTESDRVLGLELGADDYVTKPFSMPELDEPRARDRAPSRAGLRSSAIPCVWSAASESTSGAIRSSSTTTPCI